MVRQHFDKLNIRSPTPSALFLLMRKLTKKYRVIPAQAGIQSQYNSCLWTPAFAGVTILLLCVILDIILRYFAKNIPKKELSF